MNASFYRKVVYGTIIALLWFPLFYIGQPPSVDAEGQRHGGKLSQLRDEHSLSQADLGEIDPTSESMRLATLGLRGVALNVLWGMANHYKKTEDFEAFAATVNQITLLAPNFVAVWEFQAHNETYNVSVEYDHYKMRYAWVKKGTDLLIRGTKYNRKDTRLLNYLSWFFGHKIGRADEHKQFRELFRNDTDYHEQITQTLSMDMQDRDVLGPPELGKKGGRQPDNWLVGRQVQLRAVNLVATAGVSVRGKSELLFYSDAPMARINYCRAMEEEGVLGSVAGEAWTTAGNEWRDYGQRPIPTSWGHDILLGDLERYTARRDEIAEELDNYAAKGIREKLRLERLAKLTEAEREAIDTPLEQRTQDQMILAYDAEPKMAITAAEVANLAPPETRRQAKQLAREIDEVDAMVSRISSYRNIVNYAYWRTRCDVEKTPEALAGRRYIFEAEKKYAEGELTETASGQPGAKEYYEMAWKEWAKIYEQYPDMQSDSEAEEIVEAIQRYKAVLSQLEYRSFPPDFPLRGLLEAQRKGELLGGVAPTEPKSPDDKSPETTTPDEPKPEDAKPAETTAPQNEKPATDEPAKDTEEQDDKGAENDADKKDDQASDKPADSASENAAESADSSEPDNETSPK